MDRFEQIICDEHDLSRYLSQGYVVQLCYQYDADYEEYDEVTEQCDYRKQNQWSNIEESWTAKSRTKKRRYRVRNKFVLCRRETLAILYGARNG